MSVIINGNTYTSGVSNVEDDFAILSNTANCDGYDFDAYESKYIKVEEIELQDTYQNNFGIYSAFIDYDIELLKDLGYKVEVTDIRRENIDSSIDYLTGYCSLSKDKQYWTENTEYEFISNETLGNVFLTDSITTELQPIFLKATLKIYKLSEYRVEYEDCNEVLQSIQVQNVIEEQSLSFLDGKQGNPVTPPADYSDKFGFALVNIAESPKCLESKLVQYVSIESTNYQSGLGFPFYYDWSELGSLAFLDLKIEGIDGYCVVDIKNGNGDLIATLNSTNSPQIGTERFEIGNVNNEYLNIIITSAGAGCSPPPNEPTKLIMDLIVQSPQNTDGVILECCPCQDVDFCGADKVKIEFTNNCNELIKLVIKGKLQGGTYKITGDEFTTYSGERIRPTTNIEAQYNLVIFEYSDAFFLAIQDLIANNLTIKIGAYEYYFFTNDITPTWDNFSEYGFATIALVRKDTIKKIRRNCCN